VTKLVVFYTDSHAEMAEKYVISRAKLAGFDPKNVMKWRGSQHCQSGKYGDEGFADCMLDKLSALELVEIGEKVLYVDADVILNEGLAAYVDDLELEPNQICCQWDDGQLCLGVVVFRQSVATRDWWRFIRQYAMMTNMIDQSAMHRLLLDAKRVPVKLSALPFPSFGNWSHIRKDRSLWDGQDFDLPGDLYLWHANFTLGVANKYAMLNAIEKKLLTQATVPLH
jgi:hypothetical protein